MNILLLAAEAAPLARAGAVAETAGGLARALADLGHDVRVALSYSGVVDRDRFRPKLAARFSVPHVSGGQVARVSEVRHGGVKYYLIAGPPIPRAKHVYGLRSDEDAPRFIFTALAALGLCRALNWPPDVVHGVGDAGGLAMYWLDSEGAHDPLFQATASVFTYYDLCGARVGAGRHLRQYGLAGSDAAWLPDAARDALLGLGLAHADALAAASPTLARQSLSAQQGGGLDGLLNARRDRLCGILDGLDLEAWDPTRDRALAARFDADSPDRRVANKRALQKALELPAQAGASLVLVWAQTGLEMAAGALRTFLAEDNAAQAAVLGTGGTEAEHALIALKREFGGRVSWRRVPDDALERRCLAGADLVVAPEQAPGAARLLKALRYGAVPLAWAGSEAADVVIDYAESRRSTGFLFTEYNSSALLAALHRALRVYRAPGRWQPLQRRGMRQARQFAWPRSAAAYLAHYQLALTHRKEAVTRRMGPPAEGGHQGRPMARPGPAAPR